MLLSAASFTANVLLVRALGEFGEVNAWLMACSRGLVGLAMVCAVYWQEFQPTHLWRPGKWRNAASWAASASTSPT